jgi:hypothetical protein
MEAPSSARRSPPESSDMSEPIKVGDLVMIVRGHDCLLRKRGFEPFVVLALIPQRAGGWKCGQCGERDLGKNDAYGARAGWNKVSDDSSVPVSWLKRIPPLEELDDVKRDEEITA